jgi:S-(hydroxymethyl)glutathione dehydrogenase / alcohol dehydrogenase
MKAAILTELRKPLIVADLHLNQDEWGCTALGVGQVLVKVKYAAICGAQLNEIDGAKGPDKYLPHLLGHEGVGTVMEIGPGVTTKAVGDRVILHWRPSEGINAKGAVYSWEGDPVNAGPMACFAEQCIVSENRLTLLPDGIDERVAPLFGCSLTTAYGVCTRDAHINPGDSVVVFGCGGVGLPIVQMASLMGAVRILGVELSESKHAAARAAGATDVMTQLSFGYGVGKFDVAIDTTGAKPAIEHAYRATKAQGVTVLVGVPKEDITIYSLPLHFGKRLTGSHGGSSVPHEDIPRLASLVAAGLLNLDGLVTHEFPLDEINEAIAVVRSRTAGRVLLRMGE